MPGITPLQPAIDDTSSTPILDLHGFSLVMAKLAIRRVMLHVQRPDSAHPGEPVADVGQELVIVTG